MKKTFNEIKLERDIELDKVSLSLLGLPWYKAKKNKIMKHLVINTYAAHERSEMKK